MKMLFKLYLLGQLIALPFMVGALGDALGGGDSGSSYVPPRTEIASGSSLSASTLSAQEDLCEALHGEAKNAVQDDIQQLRYITSELYGEDTVDTCWDQQSR